MEAHLEQRPSWGRGPLGVKAHLRWRPTWAGVCRQYLSAPPPSEPLQGSTLPKGGRCSDSDSDSRV